MRCGVAAGPVGGPAPRQPACREGVSMARVDFSLRRSGSVAAVAAAVTLAGCTMCPDPYDYSGPVPNG